ncbi:MAG: efflux RND transporter permease subunit [Pseudobdellovibrionaceae bacterium]
MSNNHEKHEGAHSSGLILFAIKYPYFVIVACLMILILGGLALNQLPKDLLPSANQPAVQILSFYPGMPVDNVATSLTSRFERYTGQAIGMEKQDSKSLAGVSIVRNFFNSSADLNTAIAQTTSLVLSVLRKLPPGTQPPLILPFDPMAAMPLALVAVSGDIPEKKLVEVARYQVRNSVQSVNGAMAPTLMGGVERQVIVYLDQKKLAQYNFSPLDVLKKVTELNSFIPSGDVKLGKYDYQILSNGLADRIDDMNDYPLRSENGVEVKLKDVGQATDANKIQTNVVMIDGKSQVYVPVYRQPGANSVRVIDEVKESVKRLEEKLEGIKLTVVADQSTFIRHAIDSITEETMIGGGLAALMVLFFLGNPIATVGILLSIPLSLLCAMLGLKAFGQTINAMTLGGLALSIGVLVDNSIVVLENISKKRENGLPGMRAAIEGASEVAMPVLASTLCTLVVLFPIVFLTGISKILFSALALAVTFAMVGSYFTAMSVIPLFTIKFLPSRPVHVENLWAPLRKTQKMMEKLTQFYGHVLLKVLHHKKTFFTLIAVILAVGVAMAPKLGTELFPRADAGNFVLKARLAPGTRIEETKKIAGELNQKLRQWIEPNDLSMVITNAGILYGFAAAFTPNTGVQDMFLNVELSPERKHTSQYYAKIIREKMAKEYPGIDIGIELGGLLSSALNGGLPAPIDVQIEGSDLKKSHQLAEDVLEKIKKLNGVVDARIQQKLDSPQLYLNVDRSKANKMGLSIDSVMKSVVSTVSGSSSFSPAIWVDPKTGLDFMFGVQMPEDQVTSLDQLKSIPLTGPHQDRGVPLAKVADISERKGPSEINHVNLVPIVDIYLDAQSRDVGGLSREIQKILDQQIWPTGYRGVIRGEINDMNSTVKSLEGGFLLAAVLVYLILVIQFKSFKIPAIVMATVPIGMVGIVLMLVLTNTYFSIQAAIGGIFMIGIAVANGVLLIEFILHRVKEQKSKNSKSIEAAIIDASRIRLRPIMMTSLASILGLVPMAIGLGHGSEANIPLGRAVIGGQLLSTLLTLFLVPCLFQLLSKAEHKNSAEDSATNAAGGHL